jgi:hypothetical protein
MKARTYSSKKAKGRRLELEVAQRIRQLGLDASAHRQVLSGASEWHKGDIHSSLPFTIECKNQEKPHIWEWWEQACRQASFNKPPLLIVSGNNRPILAVLRLDELLDKLKAIRDWQEEADKFKKLNDERSN